MRKKATALPRGARGARGAKGAKGAKRAKGAKGTAPINAKTTGNAPLEVIKQTGKPTKTPTGKGLGKGGARRMGQQLKRAIIIQETKVRGKDALPKTPVRLLKHLIQTDAENPPGTSTRVILNVVSLYKNQDDITMAELKQTLADGGVNVNKKDRPVNVVTQRLVKNETRVPTARNASFKLNKEKQTDTKEVKTHSVKSPKPKGDLKQNKAPSKSPKGAEKPQKQYRKTPKPKGKPRGAAAKSYKLTGKSRKTAAKSHKSRRGTPKATRKSPKPAGKKRRTATNQAAQVQKALRAQKHRRK